MSPLPPTPRPNRRKVAEIRRALASKDPEVIHRGIAQLREADDLALWDLFVGDALSPEGVPAPPGSEVHRRVRSANRVWVAFALLEASGRASRVTHLDLSEPLTHMADARRCIELGRLDMFTGLTHLDLSGCLALDDIGAVATLSSLTCLDLRHCSDLDLEPLTGLQNLRSVRAPWASSKALRAKNLLQLGRVDGLHTLELGEVSRAEAPHLAGLTHVTHLALSGCAAVVEAVAEMPALTHLVLDSSEDVLDLAPLQRLSLESLTVQRSHRLSTVSAFAGLGQLRHLSLHRCGWRTLTGMAEVLPNLVSLTLSPTPNTLTPLTELEHLHVLRVRYRERLEPSLLLLEAVCPPLRVECLEGSDVKREPIPAAHRVQATAVDTVVDATGVTRLAAYEALKTETGDPTRAIALFSGTRGAVRTKPRRIAAGLDAKTLAAVRRVLGSDPVQALALVGALDNPALWRLITWGVWLGDDGGVRVRWDSELRRRVTGSMRAVLMEMLAQTDQLVSARRLKIQGARLPTSGLFERCPGVTRLHLSDCTLEPGALEGLTGLESLELRRCHFESLEPVLPHLRELRVVNSQGQGLDVSRMPKLEDFSIHTGVFWSRRLGPLPVTGLAHAMALRSLDFDGSNLPSFRVLADHPVLTHLRLRRSIHPTDCEALLTLPALERLDIDEGYLKQGLIRQLAERSVFELRQSPTWR